MGRLSLVLAAALASVACNPTKLKQGYCHTSKDCPGGWKCDDGDAGTWKCINPDAAMPDADAGDAGDARDAGDGGDGGDAGDAPFNCNRCGDAGPDGSRAVCAMEAGMCVECLGDGDCGGDASANKVCDTSTNKCVGCVQNSDCGGDASVNKVCEASTHKCVGCLPSDNPCSGTTPICVDKVCRPCVNDGQCELGVCMEDGHCAGRGEVIFVEFNSSGCADGDGSSAKPYCTPNQAAAQLGSGKNVIVIRGPMADRMTLNTTGVAPVIVGKQGAGNGAASIPATAATAIQVLSDTVLIRDLSVIGGTAAASKGVVVSGSSTFLNLVNLQIKVTTGLGIQADAGAQLTMDRCLVTDNSVGGVLINGAGYKIENSILAANGYGIQFNAPKASSQFRFNTVVSTVAAFCELNNPQTLSSSIVVGVTTNCSLLETVTAMPTFSSSRPYHLTAKVPCPNADASSYPNHDIDNDSRIPPLDCGADQFVQ